jgi:hypothetical protein
MQDCCLAYFLLLPGLFFMFFVAVFCTIEKGCTSTVPIRYALQRKIQGPLYPCPLPTYFLMTFDRVVDSHWFQCGSGSSISGQCLSGFGSRVLMTKNCKMLQLEKNNFINYFNIRIFLYASTECCGSGSGSTCFWAS